MGPLGGARPGRASRPPSAPPATAAPAGRHLDPSAGALADGGRRWSDRRDLPAGLARPAHPAGRAGGRLPGARLAGRFLDLVERAAARDDADRDWALTRAVAESWFKLLTYKDEYEVARLHLAADYGRVARDLGIDGPVPGDLPPAPADPAPAGPAEEAADGQAVRARVPRAAPDEAAAGNAVRRLRLGPRTGAPSGRSSRSTSS